MTRSATAAHPVRCLAAATVTAALAFLALSSASRADDALYDRASSLRYTVVAMSLADAAVPYAIAVSTARNDDPNLPASSAAMKSETSGAMAAMKPASARNTNAGLYTRVSYERRARPYNVPFPLILGIAY